MPTLFCKTTFWQIWTIHPTCSLSFLDFPESGSDTGCPAPADALRDLRCFLAIGRFGNSLPAEKLRTGSADREPLDPDISQHISSAASAPVGCAIVCEVRGTGEICRNWCRSHCIHDVLRLVNLGNLPVSSLQVSVTI